VQALSDDTYKSFAAEHASGFVLFVYAPWCGHSKALRPEFEAASRLMSSSSLPFASLDGTAAEATATALDVKGYPSLLFVRQGVPDEYDGDRTAARIVAWAQRKLNPELPTFTSEAALQGWLDGKTVSAVLFVSSLESEVEAVEAMRGVAGAVSLPCALSTVSSTSLSDARPPSLVVFKTFDDRAAVLADSDKLNRKAMERFVRVESMPWVTELKVGKEEMVFGRDVDLTVLHFHRGRAPTEELAAAAKQLRGTAVFATVDAPKHDEVTSYFDVEPNGVLPTPVTMVFAPDTYDKYAYTGEITGDGLAAFVRSVKAGSERPHLRSAPAPARNGDAPLVELVGSTYEETVFESGKDVLVLLYSPDCGHCRKLLPVYEALAQKVADDSELLIAQMDAIANDVPGLQPDGYPTIVFYTKGNRRGVEYDGSRDLHDMIQFMSDVRAGREHIGGLTDYPEDIAKEGGASKWEL